MNFENYINEIGKKAKNASRKLATVSSTVKDAALEEMASALENNRDKIIKENQIDVKNAEEKGISKAKIERLVLNEKRISNMATGLRDLVALKDPIGEVLSMWKRPNGLLIGRVRIPLGVIGIIYESRPNVTSDAAGICLKSGNAIILRGGSEAINSNKIITDIISEAASKVGAPKNCIQLLENTDRKLVDLMLKLNQYIDVIIPRGGRTLIQKVVQNSTVPTIETGEGIVSIFVNYDADFEMAKEIIINAKTQRPAVCNAVDKLLVHEKVADKFLPYIQKSLQNHNVEIRGCNRTKAIIPDVKEAKEEDWSSEYLDLIIAIRIVKSLKGALDIIAENDSKHSESIITNDYSDAQKFLNHVDASSVYVNASTRFTDGGQFGLGAEIGISTQKLHARGPMSVNELTSTKFIIYGKGQIRK
ncbi:MAG: glutamate-5-semialdehyde dehydrogenase [Candidatus Lokiarchaeota archaeon]|nr:glutamate-5-semialdehyde dehydrogenase [Candidatus Lokiarchaeota archaeon]